MLSDSIPPQRRGIYQGIFNFFVVLPEIIAALGLGWVMQHLLHDNRLLAVVMGGGVFADCRCLNFIDRQQPPWQFNLRGAS